MSPHTQTVPEAADVAALRIQQTYLERTLTALQQQTSEGLMSISAKLDTLNDVRTDLAKLDARLMSQNDSLVRSHSRLDELTRSVAEHVQDSNAWRETVQLRLDGKTTPLQIELNAISKTMAAWRGTFIGVQGVMSLLLALLIWVASGYIAKIEAGMLRIDKLERRSETTDRRIDNSIQNEAQKKP